ncbi:MAG TPA: hypothetical protein PKW15_01420 [Alphaproteobacteria bacterium]|nr:hypothetical protein [Rhodospirillaceae bacterium]HRJ11883.1 hypothetical protein [Alphaproteobacteria bacterium]
MIAVAPDMRGSFTTSFIMHAVIFAAMILGLPHLSPPPLELSQPIAIDIIDVGEVTTTNVQGMGQIAQKNENVAAPVAQPPQADKPEPAKPNPAPDKPKVNEREALDELIAGEAKKNEKPKDKPKPKEEAQNFDSLLKNLSASDAQPTPVNDNPVKANDGPVSGSPGIVSDKLTISEEDALRRQIEQCWNIPTGAKDAQNMLVEVRVEVNPDKTVRSAEVVNNSQMSDPFYRAAAESAKRAILNPKCSPLMLPDGREESWKVMTLRFNPKDVL